MASSNVELARQFSLLHPKEAAEVLDQMSPTAGTDFLRGLEPAISASLLSSMLPSSAAAHLENMPLEEVVEATRAMPLQQAANVIRLMPPGLRRQTIDRQNPVRRSQIQFHMGQFKRVVGAWAETEVVTSRRNESADSIRKKLSLYKGDIPLIFVLEADRKVLGTINPATLISVPPATQASDIAKSPPALIGARTPVDVALTNEAWRKNDILGVVENGEAFLGVVRYAVLRHALDDMSDEVRPELAGSPVLGLTDVWFLGLSDVLSASIGSRDHN